MSVGSGIFLSAIFLGVIALFVATKDRWNWKKIVLRSVGGVVAVAVVSGAGIYLWLTYQESPPRPVVATEFWGLKLSSTQGDVRFNKGAADHIHVYTREKTDPFEKSEVWVYAETEEARKIAKKGEGMPWDAFGVGFRDGEIRRIFYNGPDAWKGPKLHGIASGASMETVIRLLGEPSYVSIDEDELTRIINFEKLNSYFVLSQNKVTEYGIFNPKFGAVKYTKERTGKK